MANVENPYETNLSNNLVVTSYVDESTVKSDYKILFYQTGNGYPLEENFEVHFKTYSDFYKYSPDEQTLALVSGNPDPTAYQGMVEINDHDQEYYTGEHFGIRIIKKSDNSEITPNNCIATKIASFKPDALASNLNLNNKTGWNLYVDNYDIYNTRILNLEENFSNFERAQMIVVFLSMYGLRFGNNFSLYVPCIISSNFLDTVSDKPSGWAKIYSIAAYDSVNNIYLNFDFPNAYNVIRTSNDAATLAENEFMQYFNSITTDTVDTFDYDHFIDLLKKVDVAYQKLEKYTDDTDISVNGSSLQIRQHLNDPNTSFKISVFENAIEDKGPAIHISTTNNEMSGSFTQSGGSVWQITSPELTVPGLNFILENYESYCFADNSMVSTDKGLVAMKDLTLDHNVKCWDFDNGCITYAKPLFIQTHGKVSKSFEAVFDDGTICKYSKPHRCYCVDTRLFESLSYARNIGKSFYFEDGSIKKLVEWRVVDEPTTVYTMLTDHYMTSFVDGILAGSNMVMIYFIDKDMKYYKKPERKGNRPNNFGIPDKIFRGLRLYESPIPKGIIMRWLKREFISF